MKPRVVFFGTGPVAAKCLEYLTDHCEVEAVITKPKPDGHNGDYPVLEIARKLGLKTFTVIDKSDLEKFVTNHTFSSNLGLLIDFGIIVTKNTINKFQNGIVNSHFSLLPEWRGADPITFAILSGQKYSGVSLMLIDEGLDTGPIIAQAKYEIKADETMPSLTAQLIKLSDKTLRQVLPLYLKGDVKPYPQKNTTLAGSTIPTYSRKLTKNDGLIDWSKPAVIIEREIRAYQPWPKSYTTLGDIRVAITKAYVLPNKPSNAKPGDIEIASEANTLSICTGSGSLYIEMLQPQGKKEMPVAAFLNGYLKRIGNHAS